MTAKRICAIACLAVSSVSSQADHCHGRRHGNFVLVRDNDNDRVLEITAGIIQGVRLHRVNEDDSACTLDKSRICLTVYLNEYWFSPDGRSVIVENGGGEAVFRKEG